MKNRGVFNSVPVHLASRWGKKRETDLTMSKAIFFALIGAFGVILGILFAPPVRELFKGFLFLAILAVFSLLGLALIFLTLKEKVKGRLKKFLLLTGISSVGFFVSIVLHNILYALFIYLFGQDFWERTGLGDEPFFFFLAIILCPIGFLVGVIGSMVLFIKKRKKR